ncbi:MAG TPA: biotin-dependent carboxyltransferase family protein [Anaerolineaceae bacterium]
MADHNFIQVLDPGVLVTIQDEGRLAYQSFGVPVSGAMDWFALRVANRLVANPSHAAGLECLAGSILLECEEDVLVAGAGCGCRLVVNDEEYPLWLAVRVRGGMQFGLKPSGEAGCWGYLAIAGGIAVPPVMGSRSTFLRGKFGGLKGRALQAGDLIPLGHPVENIHLLAGRNFSPAALPGYANHVVVRVVESAQAANFSTEDWNTFCSQEYQVSGQSDRMGYRLAGALPLSLANADVISEGMLPGIIQVPGNGQPIVMMSDCPTTGGYTKIAAVARADLPLLTQVEPGTGSVWFRKVSIPEAEVAYRQIVLGIDQFIEEEG